MLTLASNVPGLSKPKSVSNEFSNYKEHLTLHKFVHTFSFEKIVHAFWKKQKKNH